MASRERSARSRIEFKATFSPSLPMDAYKVPNLERFIAAAVERDGVEGREEYTQTMQEVKDFSEAFVAQKAAMDPTVTTRNVNTKFPKEYQEGRKQILYDKVMELYNEGRLVSLDDVSDSKAASVGITKKITLDQTKDVIAQYSPAQLKQWVLDLAPTGINVNAINELLAKYKVKGRSDIDKMKLETDDKKVALLNLLRTALGAAPLPGSRVYTTTERVQTAADAPGAVKPGLAEALARRNIRDASDLLTLKVSELNEIAKEFGISTTGTKGTVAAKIANSAAGFGKPLTKEQAQERVDDLIEMARTASSDVAFEEARQISRGVYELAGKDKVVALGKALDITKRPGGPKSANTLKAVADFLAAREVVRTQSREQISRVKTDLGACNAAPMAAVRATAEDLKIFFTPGTSQAVLCERIYLAHLKRVSQLFLRRTDAGDLEKLKAMDEKKLKAALGKYARDLDLERVPTSVSDLVNMWMMNHYEARALEMFPGALDALQRFVMRGTLPTSPAELEKLAVIFSDVQPALATIEDSADLRDRLQVLYTTFVSRVKQGQTDLVSDNVQEFSFEKPERIRSPRRMMPARSPVRSPVRSPAVSPRRSPAMTPSRIPLPASPRRSPSPVRSPAVSPRRSMMRQPLPQEEEEEFDITDM